MINPRKYKVLKEVTIIGTLYTPPEEGALEVRLEKSVGDPLIESGELEAID